MGVREFLNRHRLAAALLALLLFAVGGVCIALQLRPTSELWVVPTKDFYTVDGGETWFTDRIDRITPFDHGGKPAVLVHLFSCDGGKTRFVGYLEKLPDHALEQYRASHQGRGDTNPEADDVAGWVGRLVKKKGDKEWVAVSDPRYLDVVQVHCPDGSIVPERVLAD